MKTFSTTKWINGILRTGTLLLALPGISQAGEYWLKTVGGGLSTLTPGIVASTGELTQPLTIRIDALVGGQDVTFDGTVTVEERQVWLCKDGTRKVPEVPGDPYWNEWLDQGVTAVGYSGTLQSTSPLGYTLQLQFKSATLPTPEQPAPGQECTYGAKNYDPVQEQLATISGPAIGTPRALSYEFANVAVNGVPEPGTILLLSLGLLGLSWLSAKRVRAARGVTAVG